MMAMLSTTVVIKRTTPTSTSPEIDYIHDFWLTKTGNVSFIHGRLLQVDRSTAMQNMTMVLYSEKAPKFRGIRLGTYCNKFSVMSYDQCKSYCGEFEEPFNFSSEFMRPKTGTEGT